MRILEVRHISKSFGDKEILQGISCDLEQGEKVGLVGWNGAGKTTFIKMLMKLVEADKGSIQWADQGIGIGYLPQSTEYHLELEQEWSGEAEAQEWEALLQKTSQLGLGKVQHWQKERLPVLSGGERLKLALAKIWASQPQLIILDEPTNHLDLQGVHWLKQELDSYAGSAIIISHDRYFLDETVTKIWELEHGLLKTYVGHYTDYRQQKRREREEQQHHYEQQQRQIKRVEEQVSTLKKWSDKGHREAGKGGTAAENRQLGFKEYGRVQAKKKDKQVKSKLKRLEAELSKHKVEKPVEEQKVYFDFTSSGKRGKRIIEANELSKCFGEQQLLEKSNFYIRQGEKVALVGPNGAGKTTFIRLLLGEEQISGGALWKSNSLKIAYLSQDVKDLPLQKTALQYMDLELWQEISRARTIFANMGMREAKLTRPIEQLSLGERTRVKLVYMIMQDYDLLILDEPTNHLDLPSREQLEETLSSYTGTLLVVSHDLYLLDKLCDKLLIIEDKQMKRIEMGIKQYQQRQAEQQQLAHQQQDSMKQQEKGSKGLPFSQRAQLLQQRKEELAILETRISELLGRISLCEPETELYRQVDQELMQLMRRKKEWKELDKA